MTGWYAYNSTAVTATSITNPINGMQVPAMVLLMLGVLMVGVFFISDTLFRWLKQKIRSNSSATFLLIGLAFILGGLVWIVSELVMGLFVRLKAPSAKGERRSETRFFDIK